MAGQLELGDSLAQQAWWRTETWNMTLLPSHSGEKPPNHLTLGQSSAEVETGVTLIVEQLSDTFYVLQLHCRVERVLLGGEDPGHFIKNLCSLVSPHDPTEIGFDKLVRKESLQ